MLKITFSSDSIPGQNALLLTVADKNHLGEQGAKLDKKLGGAIARAMATSHFTGAKSTTLTILAPAKTRLTRLVLVGIGDAGKADGGTFTHVGGAAVAALTGKDASAVFLVDHHKGLTLDAGEAAAQAALGARLRSYRFDKYHTKLKPDQKPALRNLAVATKDTTKAKAHYAPLDKIADGVFLTRDLVTEPANVIYPETLAQEAKALSALGVKVNILDEKQMKKLGMGALLGVAQGSAAPPRLVTMQWNGNPGAKSKAPVCFVGKGVTFDTGGISIKPAAGMEEMKFDMAGAGAVIGAMKALAGRKAKANVVGVVGLVENMPSGTAQRPGDVVTTMSGQTVEVINTDAEGRLVLADALWYAQEQFKPSCIIDLATLTGAIIIALAQEHAGLFSNDDTLCRHLTEAGKAVDETLWRLPLGTAYDKMIDSPIADMKNIGERGAGSITAAQFLQRYIKKGTPWAHLDIAGTAWQSKDKPLSVKGATAFGVRLLDRFVADNHEGKMTDIRFYHLTRKSLEQALPELLEKTVERGLRAVVMTGSPERAEALTQHLWTYNPNNFLPHGNAKDGNADSQPIWLTAEDERPNNAGFLFLTDGAFSVRLGDYERVCDMFDGNDAEALAAARRRWAECKKDGHSLTYWKQTDTGWSDATPQ